MQSYYKFIPAIFPRGRNRYSAASEKHLGSLPDADGCRATERLGGVPLRSCWLEQQLRRRQSLETLVHRTWVSPWPYRGGITLPDRLRRIARCEHAEYVFHRQTASAGDGFPSEDFRVHGFTVIRVRSSAARAGHEVRNRLDPTARAPVTPLDRWQAPRGRKLPGGCCMSKGPTV